MTSLTKEDIDAAAAAAASAVEDLRQTRSTLSTDSFNLTAELVSLSTKEAELISNRNTLQRQLISEGNPSINEEIKNIDNTLTRLTSEKAILNTNITSTNDRLFQINKQLAIQEVAPGRVESVPDSSTAETPSVQGAVTYRVAPAGDTPVEPSTAVVGSVAYSAAPADTTSVQTATVGVNAVTYRVAPPGEILVESSTAVVGTVTQEVVTRIAAPPSTPLPAPVISAPESSHRAVANLNDSITDLESQLNSEIVNLNASKKNIASIKAELDNRGLALSDSESNVLLANLRQQEIILEQSNIIISNTTSDLTLLRKQLGFQEVAVGVVIPARVSDTAEPAVKSTIDKETPESSLNRVFFEPAFYAIEPYVDSTEPSVPLTRTVKTPSEIDEEASAIERAQEVQAFESRRIPRAQELVAREIEEEKDRQEKARLDNLTAIARTIPPDIGEEALALSYEIASQQREFGGDALSSGVSTSGTTGDTINTVTTGSNSTPVVASVTAPDWRFRISLAANAQYFYRVASRGEILFPLNATNGVIFPYTPRIDIVYNANYESTDITHTNYKFYNYRNSSVDMINISGTFTAQDTDEANYVLAVIHFFRSATKMWYGNDNQPRAGTPPPLLYLTGHGSYAFNRHPVVLTAFTLSYPDDVDYINAGVLGGQGRPLPQYTRPIVGRPSVLDRLKNSNLGRNGSRIVNNLNQTRVGSVETSAATRIPTKLTINLSMLPIITRNVISNKFSLAEYAKGGLLRGDINKAIGGGIW